MKESWPEIFNEVDKERAEAIDKLIEIIVQSRTIRMENNIKPSKELHIMVEGLEADDSIRQILYRMTKLNIIESTGEETIVRPTTYGKVIYIMNEIVDKQAELEKIEKELTRLESEIERSKNMLGNERFVSKAPAEKVEEERKKLVSYQNSYETLLEKKKELN